MQPDPKEPAVPKPKSLLTCRATGQPAVLAGERHPSVPAVLVCELPDGHDVRDGTDHQARFLNPPVSFPSTASWAVATWPAASYQCDGTVVDAGGGHIRVYVDRDTASYPAAGARVRVTVLPAG